MPPALPAPLCLQAQLGLQLTPKSNWIREGNGKEGRDYSREHSRDPSLPQAAPQHGENFSSSVAMENATFHPEMPQGSALTSTDPQPHRCGN